MTNWDTTPRRQETERLGAALTYWAGSILFYPGIRSVCTLFHYFIVQRNGHTRLGWMLQSERSLRKVLASIFRDFSAPISSQVSLLNRSGRGERRDSQAFEFVRHKQSLSLDALDFASVPQLDIISDATPSIHLDMIRGDRRLRNRKRREHLRHPTDIHHRRNSQVLPSGSSFRSSRVKDDRIHQRST